MLGGETRSLSSLEESLLCPGQIGERGRISLVQTVVFQGIETGEVCDPGVRVERGGRERWARQKE